MKTMTALKRSVRVAIAAGAVSVLVVASVSTTATAAERFAQAAPMGAETYQGDGGKIRVPSNPAGAQSWAVSSMLKLELDKKYGFVLETFPSPTIQTSANAIQSGNADLASFGWNDVARMKNAGIKVVGIGPILAFGADYILVPKTSAVQNIGDLKGRKIGVTTRTSLNWIAMLAAAKSTYKIDLEKAATVQEAGVGVLVGLMEQGQLDATHMFNNVTAPMLVTDKYRIMVQMKALLAQLALPPTPFLIWAVQTDYAAAHPKNVKAFLAAYREAIANLLTQDTVWIEHGAELKLNQQTAELLRDGMRPELWSRFAPTSEADLRTTFDTLLAAGGSDLLGMTRLPNGIITLDYQ